MKAKEPRDRAASVRARLLNLARARGEDFQVTLRSYLFERFLYRLSRSEMRERFVLKGAMLLLARDALRCEEGSIPLLWGRLMTMRLVPLCLLTGLMLTTASISIWPEAVSAQSPVRASVSAEPSATPDAGSPKDESDLDRRIENECPGAIKRLGWLGNAKSKPAVSEPTRPALRRELLFMKDRDQELRNAAGAGGSPTSTTAGVQIDAVNLRRLKHIVIQDGFPTRTMVGDDGVDAAWLLTQHADSDPAFQARILRVLAARVRQHAFDPSELAMLTDRVLIHEGKPQRYGTQFGNDGSGLKPGKMEDPAHVDQRRASVGLGPLADYSCAMGVVYGTSAVSPDR